MVGHTNSYVCGQQSISRVIHQVASIFRIEEKVALAFVTLSKAKGLVLHMQITRLPGMGFLALRPSELISGTNFH